MTIIRVSLGSATRELTFESITALDFRMMSGSGALKSTLKSRRAASRSSLFVRA